MYIGRTQEISNPINYTNVYTVKDLGCLSRTEGEW